MNEPFANAAEVRELLWRLHRLGLEDFAPEAYPEEWDNLLHRLARLVDLTSFEVASAWGKKQAR